MHENLLLLLLYFFKSRSRRTNLCFAQPLLNIRVLSCLHLHPQKKTQILLCWLQNWLAFDANIFIRLRFTFTSVTSKRCSTYLQITRSATSMLTSKCVCVWRSERERESERQSVSLSRNPNDGIEWPRLSLPWWQAPWICVTEGKERAETQRSTQDFDRVKRKANY